MGQVNPIEITHLVSAAEAAYTTLVHHITREHMAGETFNGVMPTVYARWPIILRHLNVSVATPSGVRYKRYPIYLYYLPSPSMAGNLRQSLSGYLGQADWQGALPCDWGFGYSIGPNALVVGDVITINGSYEARDPRTGPSGSGGNNANDSVNWEDVPTTVLAQNGAAATGGIAYSRLTVGVGELVRVDLMWSLHDDDGGARVIAWNIYDGVSTIALDGGQSLAPGVRYQLYGGLITGTVQAAIAAPVPIVLGPTGYIEARVGTAMVDGHIVNISGLYRRLQGVR